MSKFMRLPGALLRTVLQWFQETRRLSRILDQRFLYLAIAVLTVLSILTLNSYRQSSSSPAPAQASVSMMIQTPLSTSGSEIIDASGRPIMLRGVNWFGIETETQAPHGLWARDYKEMLAQMKGLGYNLIRLPYSVQALQGTSVSGINFDLGSNQDLQGKMPLEVMDAIIQEAGQQGLLILLDSHRLNNERIPELWYGDGFSEADWINTWKMLAERYKNQPNVIGADLKNEPHGRASWGTNDRLTDWRLAAERAGNAILKINPNWLIIVEGVEKNVPGQKLQRHWMGGNLEGVRNAPVRLSVPNKLVYSPHEYGPGVFDQPWFAEKTFPRNLVSRWDTGFHYIARRNLAPILIGEFGGRNVDDQSKEGIWQRELVGFIKRHRVSFAYWSWNPNSGDTGGLLQDNWQAIDAPKQTLLSQLLPAPTIAPVIAAPLPRPTIVALQPSPVPTPKPSLVAAPKPSATPKPSASPKPVSVPPQDARSQPAPTQSPKPKVTPASKASNQLQSKLIKQSDWQAGFCVGLQVTNQGATPIKGWSLRFQMNEAEIEQSWNGKFERRGAQYKVTPPNWGETINPNQTVDMGFCAKKLGKDYAVSAIAVSQD
jgi:endoglucanase